LTGKRVKREIVSRPISPAPKQQNRRVAKTKLKHEFDMKEELSTPGSSSRSIPELQMEF
jgi:hypothetical protein